MYLAFHFSKGSLLWSIDNSLQPRIIKHLISYRNELECLSLSVTSILKLSPQTLDWVESGWLWNSLFRNRIRSFQTKSLVSLVKMSCSHSIFKYKCLNLKMPSCQNELVKMLLNWNALNSKYVSQNALSSKRSQVK